MQVRSLLEVAAEQDREQQAKDRVRIEAQQYRAWLRLKPATIGEQPQPMAEGGEIRSFANGGWASHYSWAGQAPPAEITSPAAPAVWSPGYASQAVAAVDQGYTPQEQAYIDALANKPTSVWPDALYNEQPTVDAIAQALTPTDIFEAQQYAFNNIPLAEAGKIKAKKAMNFVQAGGDFPDATSLLTGILQDKMLAAAVPGGHIAVHDGYLAPEDAQGNVIVTQQHYDYIKEHAVGNEDYLDSLHIVHPTAQSEGTAARPHPAEPTAFATPPPGRYTPLQERLMQRFSDQVTQGTQHVLDSELDPSLAKLVKSIGFNSQLHLTKPGEPGYNSYWGALIQGPSPTGTPGFQLGRFVPPPGSKEGLSASPDFIRHEVGHAVTQALGLNIPGVDPIGHQALNIITRVWRDSGGSIRWDAPLFAGLARLAQSQDIVPMDSDGVPLDKANGEQNLEALARTIYQRMQTDPAYVEEIRAVGRNAGRAFAEGGDVSVPGFASGGRIGWGRPSRSFLQDTSPSAIAPDVSPYSGPDLGITTPGYTPQELQYMQIAKENQYIQLLAEKMNPVGSSYVQDPEADRPSTYPAKLQQDVQDAEQQAQDYQKQVQQKLQDHLKAVELQQAVAAFAPKDALAAQRDAFNNKPPGTTAAQEFGKTLQSMSPEDQYALTLLAPIMEQYGYTPEDIARISKQKELSTRYPGEAALAGVRQQVEAVKSLSQQLAQGKITQEQAQNQLQEAQTGNVQQVGPTALRTEGTDLQRVTGSALVPPSALEAIGNVPVAGKPFERAIAGVTSPAALMAGAVTPGLTTPGLLVSGLGSGVLGTGAAALHAPAPVQFGAEAVGGALTGGMLSDVGTGLRGRIADYLSQAEASRIPQAVTREAGMLPAAEAQGLGSSLPTAEPQLPGVSAAPAPHVPEVLGAVDRPHLTVPSQYADYVSSQGSNAFVRAGGGEVMFVGNPDNVIEVTVTPRSSFYGETGPRMTPPEANQIIQDFRTANPERQFVMTNEDANWLKQGQIAPHMGPEPLPPTQEILAAPAPPSIGGGAQVTAQELAARQAPQQAVQQVVAAPARQAREAWRLYEGAQSVSNIRLQNWQRDAYQLAQQDGVNIARKGAPSDQQLGILEHTWLHDPTSSAPPNEQRLIQALYDEHTATTARLLAADPDFVPIEDHFPHMFKPSTEGTPGQRGFNLKPGFMRERTLEGPLGQILRDNPNLELRTYDPVQVVAQYEAAADNYVASLEAIHGLKAKGLIVPKGEAPAGWRTPDIGSFKIGQKLSGWAAEPKVATTLEQMFGKSAFDQNGLLKAVKFTQQSLFKLKVFGGLFQGIDYTARGMGLGTSELARLHPLQAGRAWFSPIRAVARSVIPGLDAAAMRAAESSPELQALYRNGLAASVDPSIADKAITGMGAIVPQTVAGHAIPGANWIQQALEFISGGAYQKFHTEMLEQAGLVNLQKQLRGGVPLEEAARRAAEETNAFFSSIPNWQSAVKAATTRDALRIPFFATGELEGWFRLPVQAPAGFAGIIGTTVIAAEMLNKAFTGNWLPRDQLMPYKTDMSELKDLRNPRQVFFNGIPGVDYNTTFLRPRLPWKGPQGRYVYLDLLGQADTPFRWALDPMFATQTRLGQIPNAAINFGAFVSGKAPPFGEQMKNWQDVGRNIAQQVSPITLAGLTGTERGRIGAAGAGIQVGGLNISAEPINERVARLIAQEQPNLKGDYQTPPTRYGELSPTDKAYLDQKYPDLFTNRFKAAQESALGEISQQTESTVTRQRIDTAKQDKLGNLQEIAADVRAGKYGAPTDQQARSSAYSDLRDAITAYRSVLQNEQKVNPQFFAGSGYQGRVLNRFYQLLDALPERPKDEDWQRFEEGMAKFTPQEQALIKQETGIGDSPIELQLRDNSAALKPYYDQPQGTARADVKLSNAQVDGILWAEGKTAKVSSPDHVDEAKAAYKALYGVEPADVPVEEASLTYHSLADSIQAGTFAFADNGERSKAASSIDNALPAGDPRRVTQEQYNAALGDSSQHTGPYYGISPDIKTTNAASRENYRRQHPDVDGYLWALGRTNSVKTAAGRTAAINAFEQLWGVRPPITAVKVSN